MKRAILFVSFAAICGAQTTVNGGRDYKGTLKASGSISAVDFTGAGSTAPAKAGTSASRPAACSQGQVYFSTDAAAGQNLYFCTTGGNPGVWTQMTGGSTTGATVGAGTPSGNCTPPILYIDTTNQDLWFCGASNSWKRPTADTTGLPTLAGTNTWTGYSNLSGAQWRPPESTVASLPSPAANVGKVFMVTDAATAGNCSSGGGSLREFCRANGSVYECVGGCGSTDGGSGSGGAPYISSLIPGPDSTKTIAGATHGFATAALLVAVYDNSSPRKAISAGWTVDPSTYDVVIAFASPQTDYYVVINGGGGAANAAEGTPASLSGETSDPTVSKPTLYFSTLSGLPQYKNASNVLTGTMLVGISNPSDNNCVQYINQSGIQIRGACDPTSAKFRTVPVIGYEVGAEDAGAALTTANLTNHAIMINDANAKTLTEASCISDTGSQAVTVKIGGTTMFTITCVAPGSYSRSTTDGTTGYIIAASMVSTSIGEGAVLDLSGTANAVTKDVKLFGFGTVD